MSGEAECVSSYSARNQPVSGNLLASNTVPANTLVWVRQWLHCQYQHPCRSRRLHSALAQCGQTKPSGQRNANKASRHGVSVPKRRWNSRSDKPAWNCVWLVGMLTSQGRFGRLRCRVVCD